MTDYTVVPAEEEDEKIRRFRKSRMAKNLGECEASDEEQAAIQEAWERFQREDDGK